MWGVDPRAAGLTGTLAGAHMAVNTWNQHQRSHNKNQPERVMTGVLGSAFVDADAEFWKIVDQMETIAVPVLS
jgi:hypothetical protein